MGVLVSWLAKNTRVNSCDRTKAGTPQAYWRSAWAVESASKWVNSPRV